MFFPVDLGHGMDMEEMKGENEEAEAGVYSRGNPWLICHVELAKAVS